MARSPITLDWMIQRVEMRKGRITSMALFRFK